MGIDKNLVQGSMALLLLRLLETKDMYGYEMIEALRSKSNNVFELKAGTLCNVLRGCFFREKTQILPADRGRPASFFRKKAGMDDLSVGSHQCTEYGRRMLGWMKKSTCRRSESRS